MIQNCLRDTTAHGIPRIAQENGNPLTRFVWLLFTIGTLGVFLYHSSTLLKQLLSEPVSTEIQISKSPFKIPDVWLCPNQIYSPSQIASEPLLNDEKMFKDATNLSVQIYNSLFQQPDTDDAANLFFQPTLAQWRLYKAFGKRISQTFFLDASEVEIVPHFEHFYCFRFQPKGEDLASPYIKLNIFLYTDIVHTAEVLSQQLLMANQPLVNYGFNDRPTFDRKSGFRIYFPGHDMYPGFAVPSTDISGASETLISITNVITQRVASKHNRCDDKSSDKLIKVI